MRKIFIDCGGEKGGSISLFKSSILYDPSFELFGFEPIPGLAESYRNSCDAIFYEGAVWIYDGEVDIYPCLERVDGSSLIKEKHDVDKDHPIKVKCIDFSQWLIRNFEITDLIIIKMDIEGSEYKVLNKMIDDGSIRYADRIYIEWHPIESVPMKAHYDLLLRIEGERLTAKFFPEMRTVLERRKE